MEQYVLQHHGVKGMKWGVRKKRQDRTASTTSRRLKDQPDDSNDSKKKGLTDKQKKALKVGAAVAGTVLVAYGAYKLNECVKNKAYKVALERGRESAKKYMNTQNSKWLKVAGDAINSGDDKGAKYILDSLDRTERILKDSNYSYAYNHSKTTREAVKTLLNKNYELTLGELYELGLTPRYPYSL